MRSMMLVRRILRASAIGAAAAIAVAGAYAERHRAPDQP